MNFILIFLGAGVGGVCRYMISNSCYYFLGRNFPFGTLLVNSSGCFLMGLLFVIINERFESLHSILRSLLLVGFLGGYTTFSSFSFETVSLFENGAYLAAMVNIALNFFLCLLGTTVGILGARQL